MKSLTQLDRTLDKYLTDFFDDNFYKAPGLDFHFANSPDFYKRDDRYELYVPLPGIKKKDISATVDGNTLQITVNNHDALPYRNFFYRDSLNRSYVIPEDADPSKAEAKYKNGLLKIVLYKTRNAAVKRIKVAEAKPAKKLKSGVGWKKGRLLIQKIKEAFKAQTPAFNMRKLLLSEK